jgi:uncharacterized membrane protein YhaH (DUF805 family)
MRPSAWNRRVVVGGEVYRWKRPQDWGDGGDPALAQAQYLMEEPALADLFSESRCLPGAMRLLTGRVRRNFGKAAAWGRLGAMKLVEAVKVCFAKYAVFEGRARRAEFWWFALFELMVLVVAMLMDGGSDEPGYRRGGSNLGFVEILILLALFLPGLAVQVRRLHDTNASGWWVLASLIPVVGGPALLIWNCVPGTKGANRYGPDPLQSEVDGASAPLPANPDVEPGAGEPREQDQGRAPGVGLAAGERVRREPTLHGLKAGEPAPAKPSELDNDIAAKLAKLSELYHSGALTADEFAMAKQRLGS